MCCVEKWLLWWYNHHLISKFIVNHTQDRSLVITPLLLAEMLKDHSHPTTWLRIENRVLNVSGLVMGTGQAMGEMSEPEDRLAIAWSARFASWLRSILLCDWVIRVLVSYLLPPSIPTLSCCNSTFEYGRKTTERSSFLKLLHTRLSLLERLVNNYLKSPLLLSLLLYY